ncbi:MAG: radical SAM protein [Candidatus Odinarchaeia archaeon]
MTTVLNSSNQDYIKYLKEGWFITRRMFKDKITFFAPNILEFRSERFPIETSGIFQSVSVTGRKCALMCEHCRGKLLESMHHVLNPEQLIELGEKLSKRGCKGLLISGGADINGHVPLELFIQSIKKLHEKLGFKIAVHTGLIDYELAKRLKEAGVESAMIDIIGSTETIREIYHLNKTPEDYDKSLQALVKAGLETSPHIVVGLHRGEIKGELNAINIISKYEVKNIVVVAYKPLEETLINRKVATPLQIGKIITIIRLKNKQTPILLGCARPGGFHKIKTDILAVKAGVNGIAFPSDEVISYVEKINLKIEFKPYCCSFLSI